MRKGRWDCHVCLFELLEDLLADPFRIVDLVGSDTISCGLDLLAQLLLSQDLLATAARGSGVECLGSDLMLVPGKEISELIFARSTRVSLAVSKDLGQFVVCFLDELAKMVGAGTVVVQLRLTERSVIVGGELQQCRVAMVRGFLDQEEAPKVQRLNLVERNQGCAAVPSSHVVNGLY
jgi:hypothetical protein